MVCGKGNVDYAILDQLRKIEDRLDVVEIAQRRGAHLEDVSDDEVVAPNPNLKLEEDQDKERLLRVLSREHLKPIVEVVPYDGKLDTNAMLEWIFEMEKLFEYGNTSNNSKVKITVTRLKGHASLWWEHLQIDRKKEKKGKDYNLGENSEQGKEKNPSC